jgi:parvulin-like peptidyl-prolyl isomerase
LNQNMKTKMKLIFPAMLGAMLFAFPSAQAATANVSTNKPPVSTGTNSNPEAAMTALFGDPVIAKGKGFEIKRSQLDELVTKFKAAAAARNMSIPSEQTVEKGALDNLIAEPLLLARANDADRNKGVQSANLQMAAVLEQAGSQEALDRMFKARGVTAEAYRKEIAQFATANSVLERELKVVVTDEEATNFYAEHHAYFEQPETVHLRDILLLKIDPATGQPLTADQQQAKRKQIDDLLKRIRGGESFTNLAAKYSEDLSSKKKGGELPSLSRDRIPAELAAAAFSMTNNQVSDVIEVPNGCCIIKLVDKNPAKVEPYSGVDTKVAGVPPGQEPVTIRDILNARAVQVQTPAFLEKLKKDANVEILDPDLKALEEKSESKADTIMPATPNAK